MTRLRPYSRMAGGRNHFGKYFSSKHSRKYFSVFFLNIIDIVVCLRQNICMNGGQQNHFVAFCNKLWCTPLGKCFISTVSGVWTVSTKWSELKTHAPCSIGSLSNCLHFLSFHRQLLALLIWSMIFETSWFPMQSISKQSKFCKITNVLFVLFMPPSSTICFLWRKSFEMNWRPTNCTVFHQNIVISFALMFTEGKGP